jgi:hypothetical protein
VLISWAICRSVTKETGPRLEEALEAAPYGTKHMKDIVRSCATNARCEMAAADALREVVNTKGGVSGLGNALEQLNAAISAAAIYPSLQVSCIGLASGCLSGVWLYLLLCILHMLFL